jgi:hypothetical protein
MGQRIFIYKQTQPVQTERDSFHNMALNMELKAPTEKAQMID